MNLDQLVLDDPKVIPYLTQLVNLNSDGPDWHYEVRPDATVGSVYCIHQLVEYVMRVRYLNMPGPIRKHIDCPAAYTLSPQLWMDNPYGPLYG